MLLKKLLATLLLLALAFTALPGGQQAAVAESKYYIDVDVTNQYVTVYRKSDNAIVRQMICSTGASGSSTPLGTFVMPNKRYSNERTEWYHTLGVYVKYASRIYQGILFHSVPFSSRNEATLQQDAFNKLGSPASHGCIRLRVDDSKWIADNCPPGTVVRIFRSNSRNEIVRGVLLEVGSYSIDSGVPYNQFIGLSDDPDTLDRASSGPEVRDLQMLLQSLGFFTGTPDGTYNTLTVQAVAAFQEAAGWRLRAWPIWGRAIWLLPPTRPLARAQLSPSACLAARWKNCRRRCLRSSSTTAPSTASTARQLLRLCATCRASNS